MRSGGVSNDRRPPPMLSEGELPAIKPLEFVVDRGEDGAPVLDVRESEFEQVYNLHPFADADGRSLVMLRNAAGDRAVSMGFAVAELPYVTLWKNAAPISA